MKSDSEEGAGLLYTAMGLALASAIALGLARFAYALLLPAMRADLDWSYATAGALNTVNAAGYLAGALMLPRWQARFDGKAVVVAGGLGACATLFLHGLVRSEEALFVLRFASGVASAASFAGGGLLAASLAQQPGGAPRLGLILGIYYGGTGLGIAACALAVPWAMSAEVGAQWSAWWASGLAGVSTGPVDGAPVVGLADWQRAWIGLAGLAVLCHLGMLAMTRSLHCPPVPASLREAAPLRALLWGLLGYLCFGLGYIGYMTFIITLLREQGLSAPVVTAFYVVLGLGVVASSWLWAGLLQKHRNGRPMATLNALLALATVLPVLSSHPVAVFASGALFGSVFLSVVASTTALVRHNCAKAAWPAGIAAFTVIFAAGQMVGPVLVGLVADGAGGLQRGFVVSAAALALGALLASRQRAL
ncbi:MAG: YbfB/YjiJ family MFS transporter [Burkholderiales bacterium]|nr:YbfB/YjiJ family MFS transporter [Burkholderiales bacterium]NBO76111.1 YbfB/YjiJ family MFS transporter [Betaproteobacteria bacterium]